MQKRRPQKSQPATSQNSIPLAAPQSSHPKAVEHQQPLLVLWDDLPAFLQDNEYIYNGYRPQSNSYQKCIRSLTYFHNQTVNIYTQAIGVSILILIGSILIKGSEPRFVAASQEDVIVFNSFILSWVACLSLSFIFHTITNHSPDVQRFWLNLDFLGLLIAVSGGFIPAIWYTFYCTPKKTKILLITLNICAQSITAYVTLFVPTFRTPQWRPVRAIVFGLMGSLAFIPIIVGFFVFGLDEIFFKERTIMLLRRCRICHAHFSMLPAGRKNGDQENLTFGVIHTSYFTCSGFSVPYRIYWGCFKPWTIRRKLEDVEYLEGVVTPSGRRPGTR